MISSSYKNAIISLACGLGMGVALVTPPVWFLSVIALAIAIASVRSAPSLTYALSYGYLVGFGVVGVAASWIFLSYPTEWIGIPDHIGVFVLFSIWFVYTSLMALAAIPWSIFLWIARPLPAALYIPGIAALWGLSDALRSLIYNLISWAPEHAVGLHGGFGIAGAALAWSDQFLWLARLGGVWALSITTALLALLLLYVWNYIRTQMWCVRGAVLATFGGIAIAFIYIHIPPAVVGTLGDSFVETEDQRIVLIQTDFPRTYELTQAEQKTRVESMVQQITHLIELERPNVVVLPEDSRLISGLTLLTEDERTRFIKQLGEKKIMVVDSARTRTWDGVHNVIFIHTYPEDAPPTLITKIVLAPFGEYIPSFFAHIWGAAGLADALEKYTDSRAYLSGATATRVDEHMLEHNGAHFGFFSCSEVLSPTLYGMLPSSTAVFVNVSSISWARGSPLLFNQMLALARTHSVYNRTAYVQATNGGPNVVLIPQ